MRAGGIHTVIDQWTVDMDANQAYYPDPAGWYPEYVDMVGPLLSAARSNQMSVCYSSAGFARSAGMLEAEDEAQAAVLL